MVSRVKQMHSFVGSTVNVCRETSSRLRKDTRQDRDGCADRSKARREVLWRFPANRNMSLRVAETRKRAAVSVGGAMGAGGREQGAMSFTCGVCHLVSIGASPMPGTMG